jgi:hypothetical protein
MGAGSETAKEAQVERYLKRNGLTDYNGWANIPKDVWEYTLPAIKSSRSG